MNCVRFQCPKWPVVRKCCFCVPIRKAVTIFGYVNVVAALLGTPVLVYALVGYHTSGPNPDREPAPLDPAIDLTLSIAYVLMDAVMNVVMLIGAHRKKKLLLQVYFYYTAVFLPISVCLDLHTFKYDEYIKNAVYIFLVGLNCYLLFLVYNLIHLIELTNLEVQYVEYAEPAGTQHRALLRI